MKGQVIDMATRNYTKDKRYGARLSNEAKEHMVDATSGSTFAQENLGKDPKITTVAGTHYIDNESIRDKKEVFVRKSTTSVRHVDTSSSGGSRGGYSGGGHSFGSSGVSHGGGGGRF